MRWPGFADASVVVTGASGFVGAHLARRLVAAGARVHVLARPSSDLWRLGEAQARVTRHDADLTDAAAVAAAVAEARPAVIYHSAAYGGYAGEDDARAIIDTNLRGTVNLLAAASDACLIHVGSSSEYGLKTEPMREDMALEPATLYGVTKAAATLACRAAAQRTGRRIATARLFSPYGPMEAPGRLIPSVIRACLAGEDPEVTAGDQARDFVFINDAIDCLLRMPAAVLSPGEVVNVGSGRQATVREVVERIVALTGAAVTPRWGAVATRQPETRTWVADITRAQARLGWTPATSLDDGLRATIVWMRDHADVHAVA
jgi:nucleoside-diphosphate-sugar epimerase